MTTVEFSIAPNHKPFWCIPGLFWGDNQQDGTGEYYPRFLASATKPGRFESSFWEFDVWRAAQPLVAAHDGAGWWVLEVEPQVGVMVTEQFYFIDWSALGHSVSLIEEDGRRADYDVGPHYRNHGNLAGFSHAWCTAFVLRSALARISNS